MKIVRSSTEVLTRKILIVKLDDGTKITCVDLFDDCDSVVDTEYRYMDGDLVTDPILIEELNDFTMAVYAEG